MKKSERVSQLPVSYIPKLGDVVKWIDNATGVNGDKLPAEQWPPEYGIGCIVKVPESTGGVRGMVMVALPPISPRHTLRFCFFPTENVRLIKTPEDGEQISSCDIRWDE